MTNVVDKFYLEEHPTKATEFYKYDGKFITIMFEGKEILFLFSSGYNHSDMYGIVSTTYVGNKLISAGFCKFDMYDAEDYPTRVPLTATGRSFTLPVAERAREKDNDMIQEYFKTKFSNIFSS